MGSCGVMKITRFSLLRKKFALLKNIFLPSNYIMVVCICSSFHFRGGAWIINVPIFVSEQSTYTHYYGHKS